MTYYIQNNYRPSIAFIDYISYSYRQLIHHRLIIDIPSDMIFLPYRPPLCTWLPGWED